MSRYADSPTREAIVARNGERVSVGFAQAFIKDHSLRSVVLWDNVFMTSGRLEIPAADESIEIRDDRVDVDDLLEALGY